MKIPTCRVAVPDLSSEQMIEVDRAMIEDYGIDLVQMMENAGRNLATLARERFLDQRPEGKRVVALAGTGGNGGGVLVAVRRLLNWGAQVEVVTTRKDEAFTPVAARQLRTARRVGAVVSLAGDDRGMDSADLLLDGVIGYSLRGAPRGPAAQLIHMANAQKAPVLSLDVPSGIDATTGQAYDPSIRATATMTLALPKRGLRAPGTRDRVGELYLADIGVPPALYAGDSLGLQVGPIFAEGDILRLRP
jgi:NAD(P)H-hydrate epimerase